MYKLRRFVFFAFVFLLLSGCAFPDFPQTPNDQFGDQHLKTAISLIELHKIREGEYPESLSDLKYIGDWDKIGFSSVKYTKLISGYELDVVNGFLGKPENLEYPDDFWNGLGLEKSNLKK